MKYTILEWDSDFFGFGVARIDVENCSKDDISFLRTILQKQGVRLAYWSVSPKDIVSNETAWHVNATLADEKVTYSLNLTCDICPSYTPSILIEPFIPTYSLTTMEALAVQSGVYSRFAVDPMIPSGKYEDLYKIWIKKSISKEIAHEVLVACNDGAVSGMITLGEKNGVGDIGLVSVDSRARGKGIGKALVSRALEHFQKQYSVCQVVTQKQNKPACALYEKCGFKLQQTESIYHIWL